MTLFTARITNTTFDTSYLDCKGIDIIEESTHAAQSFIDRLIPPTVADLELHLDGNCIAERECGEWYDRLVVVNNEAAEVVYPAPFAFKRYDLTLLHRLQQAYGMYLEGKHTRALNKFHVITCDYHVDGGQIYNTVEQAVHSCINIPRKTDVTLSHTDYEHYNTEATTMHLGILRNLQSMLWDAITEFNNAKDWRGYKEACTGMRDAIQRFDVERTLPVRMPKESWKNYAGSMLSALGVI